MPISDAKLLANRRNALLSTGPKSTHSKIKVRGNAFKHGLTGQGVALPSEDREEIEAFFIDIQEQMRPDTVAGEQLLRRYAFLNVRLRRCERLDNSRTGENVRHALDRFDDERLAAIELLTTRLHAEPATTVRRLQKSREGIDWLLGEWATLRSDLLNADRDRWNSNHSAQMDALMGRALGSYRVGRTKALSESLKGYFHNIDPSDGEGLDEKARSEWARDQLRGQIDAEVERLKEVQSRIDPTILERDRAEAGDRALFDDSPEAALARKYEASTERAIHAALKEYRKVELDRVNTVLLEIQPVDQAIEVEMAGQGEIEGGESVALNFQEAEAKPKVEVAEPSPPSRSQASIGSESIGAKNEVEYPSLC